MVSAGLAGCTGKPAAPGGEPGATRAPSAPANVTTAMPDNRSGEIIGFKETNRTQPGLGSVSHDHDYWNGRTRVTLFETQARMGTTPDAGGSSATFRVPPPGLVFEGTSELEFTVKDPQRHACLPLLVVGGRRVCTPSATDPTPPPALTLDYQHAGTTDWTEAGPLAWNVPAVIDLDDPRMTDMPHSTWSLWRFRVRSAQALDFTFDFNATGVIVRDRDVPPWPGHPDFYADNPLRLLYDGPAATTDDGPLAEGGQAQAQPVPAKLVSWGTRTLLVDVNITGVEGALPPTHWYLQFHNTSGVWNITSPFNDAYKAGQPSYHWALFVDDNGMDSPYSDQSRWEFVLRGAYTSPVISCIGGCAQYAVKYTLRIVATNQVLDAYN